MFIELIGELLNDFYPIYLSIGFYLTVLCTYHFLTISKHEIIQYQDLISQHQPLPTLFNEINMLNMGQNRSIRNWLGLKMKRVGPSDDDEADQPFSYESLNLTIRGGYSCQKNLYSLFMSFALPFYYLY